MTFYERVLMSFVRMQKVDMLNRFSDRGNIWRYVHVYKVFGLLFP